MPFGMGQALWVNSHPTEWLLMMDSYRVVNEGGHPLVPEKSGKAVPFFTTDNIQVINMTAIFQGLCHMLDQRVANPAGILLCNLSAFFCECIQPIQPYSQDGCLQFVQAAVQA